MTPQPLYNPNDVDAAYCLRYAWSAWPSKVSFAETPSKLIDDMKPAWEIDGLRVLEHQ